MTHVLYPEWLKDSPWHFQVGMEKPLLKPWRVAASQFPRYRKKWSSELNMITSYVAIQNILSHESIKAVTLLLYCPACYMASPLLRNGHVWGTSVFILRLPGWALDRIRSYPGSGEGKKGTGKC